MDVITRPLATQHEARLDKLAEVAVRVGLGLVPGQEIVLTAPIDAAPLVRRITEHAYRVGAKLVSRFFSNEQTPLARFHRAPAAPFDSAPAWLYDGMARAFEAGAARLAIGG